jgi:hypothetical protein
MLDHLPDHPGKKEIAAASAAQALLADVDTVRFKRRAYSQLLISDLNSQSLGVLLNFMYAMVLHPAAQAKARAELDAVVGRSRLPDFSDRENLPYVNALLKETLRWQVIAPLGEPRLGS